jgi:hypothetical protein
VVLTSREHVIALEARDRGLMGMLLRYPYEVRDSAEYFDEIQDVEITKDMLDWPSTSSSKNQRILIHLNLRIITSLLYRSCSIRSRKVSRSPRWHLAQAPRSSI